jgi:hypothetical protein
MIIYDELEMTLNLAVVDISPVFVQNDEAPVLRLELVTSRTDVRHIAANVRAFGCADFRRRVCRRAQTL